MKRILVGSLALMPLIGFFGCSTTEPATRPPKEAMVYRTAPDDPAYSKPLEYPKETMDADPLIKKSSKGAGLPGMSSRPGQPGVGKPGSMPGGGGSGSLF
jgi:hypothetical protein